MDRLKTLLKILLKNWKKVAIIIVAAYISYLIIDIIFFENDPKGDQVKTDIVFGKTSLIGYVGGDKQWEFYADQVEYSGNNGLARKISKGIIYKNQKPFINIKTPRIIFDLQTKNFSATSGVVIEIMEQGQKFQADNLVWNANEQKLEITNNIIAQFNNNLLTGNKLLYFVREGQFQMDDGVKMEIDIEVP